MCVCVWGGGGGGGEGGGRTCFYFSVQPMCQVVCVFLFVYPLVWFLGEIIFPFAVLGEFA